MRRSCLCAFTIEIRAVVGSKKIQVDSCIFLFRKGNIFKNISFLDILCLCFVSLFLDRTSTQLFLLMLMNLVQFLMF